ncbi:MAG: relaxase MobL [Ruminococcus sp.]|nr:relaxase MobL [Ruminococcus sp.]
MPRIIVTSRYLKSGNKKNISNYVKYIATRPGSVTKDILNEDKQVTEKQKELIETMLKDFPDSQTMYEYDDYVSNPNQNSASAFISEVLERYSDRVDSMQNYISYLANRPGAVKHGKHALFSQEDKEIELNKVAKEIAEHRGNVWTHVVSLRREDAEKMGYTDLDSWRQLILRNIPVIAKQSKIDMKNLKWYAAFHDKKTNPHVHIVVYSTDTKEGFLTKAGIEKIRSAFANDIYHDELYSLYGQQNTLRNELKKESEELMASLSVVSKDDFEMSPEVIQLVSKLSAQLNEHKGKKYYAFLRPEVKQTVDEIFSQLAENEKIKKMYELWCEVEQTKHDTYSSAKISFPPLTDNAQFKSVKNMIIRTILDMHLPETEEAAEQEQTDDEGTDYSPIDVTISDNPSDDKAKQSEQQAKEQEALTFAVMSLFVNLCSIIRNDYAQEQRKIRQKVDKKLLKMIRKKQISTGYKYNDMSM